ncbi:hypothetical protein SLS58_007959 [Diplodia intermedia]|uniref:Uncharacterized protein n=1 Tax=Diplodia intermedia TaxID=856260 RepID=A0ABR3TIR0_9PEZI
MPSDAKTFRVSITPLERDKHKLREVVGEFMTQNDEDIVIKVSSLAIHPRQRNQSVATVDFSRIPSFWHEREDQSEPLSLTSSGGIHMTFDTDFHGLTALYTPPDSQWTLEGANPTCGSEILFRQTFQTPGS